MSNGEGLLRALVRVEGAAESADCDMIGFSWPDRHMGRD